MFREVKKKSEGIKILKSIPRSRVCMYMCVCMYACVNVYMYVGMYVCMCLAQSLPLLSMESHWCSAPAPTV